MSEQPLPSDVAEARLQHLIDRARRGALLPAEADQLMTGLRDLVRRLEDTEDERDRLAAGHDALLKTTADLITSIGYARHTLADNILGQVRAPDDMSLEQIAVAVIAEYRADQSTIRRLTAGQCTHYKGTHDQRHTAVVTGCVWCTPPITET